MSSDYISNLDAIKQNVKKLSDHPAVLCIQHLTLRFITMDMQYGRNWWPLKNFLVSRFSLTVRPIFRVTFFIGNS